MKIARVQPVPRLNIEAPKEMRMVLIGKTGAGKSATANTVLDEKKFKSECAFSSVTSNCQYGVKERFGKKILIVDTPGFLDTNTPKETIDEEIKRCVAISSPGPQAFLLVTPLSHRFTNEEGEVFDAMSAMFGEKMTKYLIVVFTCRDQLDGRSVHDHVETCPEKLKKVIEAAGGGYVTFNNRGNKDEKEGDVKHLLDRVEAVVRKNGGDYFTSEMYKEAEDIMQERIAIKLEEGKEELRREVKEELLAEVEEIMRKEREYFQKVHEADLQHMERMKQEYAASKEKKGKKNKAERECERLLEDLAKKEVESSEKKRRLLQKIEALDGAERVRMQKKIAGVGVEITQIVAQRKGVEEDATAVKFSSAVEVKAQVYRTEERKMIEEEEADKSGRFTERMKTVGSNFLNLFR